MKLKYFIILLLLLVIILPAQSQVTIGDEVNIDYGAQKEYTIGGITVTGVKYLDVNVLTMLSGLTVGDKVKIPGDKITASIRKLWSRACSRM